MNGHRSIKSYCYIVNGRGHDSLLLRGRHNRDNLNNQSIRLVIGRLPRCNDKRSIDRDRLNPHYSGHKKITKRYVYRVAAQGRESFRPGRMRGYYKLSFTLNSIIRLAYFFKRAQITSNTSGAEIVFLCCLSSEIKTG